MINQVDPREMALQLVQYERANMDYMLSLQMKMLKAQQESLSKTKASLTSMQSKFKNLNKTEKLQAQSATQSQEGHMTITSNGQATDGQYQLFVTQLAKAEQSYLEFGSADDKLPSSGSIKIGTGDKTTEINLAELGPDATVKDLMAAINKQSGDTGTKAALVNNGGKVNLVLSGTETGESNAIKLEFTPGDENDESNALSAIIANKKQLTKAEDAIVLMGSGDDAIEIKRPTNKLDDVIDGISVQLTKVQKEGDEPITVTIGQDKQAIGANVKELVDNYNAMMKEMNEMTANSGAFASDSTMRAIKSQLSNTFRDLPEGVSLSDLGIKTNKDGSLTFSETDLNKSLDKNPDIVGKALGGDSGVLSKFDKMLTPYTGRDSVFNSREDSFRSTEQRINAKQEQHDKRMNAAYDRYVKQYTTMNMLLNSIQMYS